MKIENSTIRDIQEILNLYDHAIAYQNRMKAVAWPTFTYDQIIPEVNNGQQWKILIDNKIACVWMTTFDDPHIWGDKNQQPAVYIHRIAVNPNFRGQNLTKKIIHWAHAFAKEKQKEYIRLDTAGYNQKLINYYTQCGFNFLGADPLANTSNLPLHYHNTPVCLFEMKVK